MSWQMVPFCYQKFWNQAVLSCRCLCIVEICIYICFPTRRYTENSTCVKRKDFGAIVTIYFKKVPIISYKTKLTFCFYLKPLFRMAALLFQHYFRKRCQCHKFTNRSVLNNSLQFAVFFH